MNKRGWSLASSLIYIPGQGSILTGQLHQNYLAWAALGFNFLI